MSERDPLDNKARRTAKRAGLRCCKNRWRAGTIDNKGGYQLIDPYRNIVVDGVRFDLSAQDVIDKCA